MIYSEIIDIIFELQSRYLFTYETVAFAISIINELKLRQLHEIHIAVIIACKYNEDFGYRYYELDYQENIKIEWEIFQDIDFTKIKKNDFANFCHFLEKFIDPNDFFLIPGIRNIIINLWKNDSFKYHPAVILLSIKILFKHKKLEILSDKNTNAYLIFFHNFFYDYSISFDHGIKNIINILNK